MSIRTERVARLLQKEIADLLQTDFAEQVQDLVTVTFTRVTKDLSIAYVDVSIYNAILTERQAAFRHLEELTPQIRTSLAGRIRHQVRKIPEIRFFLDESLHQAKHMDQIFDRIREERERREDDL